jgi:ribosomal protein L11
MPGEKDAEVRLCIIVSLQLMLLAGCSTPAPPVLTAAPPAPVVTDNFCETARKRTWSLKDTPETIREAVAHNRAVDRRCGVPGS